jgi:hypothetical protein
MVVVDCRENFKLLQFSYFINKTIEYERYLQLGRMRQGQNVTMLNPQLNIRAACSRHPRTNDCWGNVK